jgi:hypothetical protein
LEEPLQARQLADHLDHLAKMPGGAVELSGVNGWLGRVGWHQLRLLKLGPCGDEPLDGDLIQFAYPGQVGLVTGEQRANLTGTPGLEDLDRLVQTAGSRQCIRRPARQLRDVLQLLAAASG